MLQDDYYLNIEADAFFERWHAKNNSFIGEIRANKKRHVEYMRRSCTRFFYVFNKIIKGN